MEYEAKNIDWNANAGLRLDALAKALPRSPCLELTVFGSAPLQLLVEQAFLSEDIDISPTEDAYDLVAKVVEKMGWAKGQSDFYVQVCDHLAFRTTKDWLSRSVQARRHGHLFIFPHPWDILVSKLQRLDPKDVQAFKLVIKQTGHPTEAEFAVHLQSALDLYRPKFDEESARGDMLVNTKILWQELWQKEIDVRAAIIRPALERSQHDYVPADPALKARLGNLKAPEK